MSVNIILGFNDYWKCLSWWEMINKWNVSQTYFTRQSYTYAPFTELCAAQLLPSHYQRDVKGGLVGAGSSYFITLVPETLIYQDLQTEGSRQTEDLRRSWSAPIISLRFVFNRRYCTMTSIDLNFYHPKKIVSFIWNQTFNKIKWFLNSNCTLINPVLQIIIMVI